MTAYVFDLDGTLVDSAQDLAASCNGWPNAAQPSAITVQWNSRTCASRTVEATPPLVTMPVQ